QAYRRREAEINEMGGENAMRQIERSVLLQVLDRKWREHLYEMDYLKEGIGLRAMAQRDPLVEYQREGFDMFNGMLEGLKEESVGFLFNVSVEPTQSAPVAAGQDAGAAPGQTQDGAVPAQGGTASGDGARPAPAQEPTVRAKGLGEEQAQALSYSGPSESGDAEVKNDKPAGAAAQGTRRERRAEQRAQAKKKTKGAKSKKKSRR